MAATCLLPRAAGGLELMGHCGHVLFFDLDCKLDVLRLMQILQARVELAMLAAG